MKIDGRLFIVFIIALALIPGACAITASTSGGSSLSGSGTAQGNLATDGIQTTGFSVANGVISGTENHWVEDTTGKHAEVGMSVDSAATLSYRYSLSPNKDKTKVSPQSTITAQEWLDVTNAKKIQANANARNGEGDQANVNVNILIGSITGYKNSATATMTQATASQSATSASGNQIIFNSWANNRELDNACPSLQVTTGSVTGYATTETATKTQATASQSATSASGSRIQFYSGAYNKEQDNAWASLDAQSGSINKYATSTTATLAQAKASESATSVSGSKIFFFDGAFNNEKDHTQLTEGADSYLSSTYGSITDYSTSVLADKTQATGQTLSSNGVGNNIWFAARSWNGQDPNNPNLANYDSSEGIQGSGSFTGYKNSASATSTGAKSSQTLTSGYTSGNGVYTGIGLNNRAWNKEGDIASSTTGITNGKLSTYSDTATSTKTYVDSIVMAGSASGDSINVNGHSYNSEADNSVVSITDSGVASLTSLYVNPHAALNSVETLGKVTTISGSKIKGTGTSFNAEGDSAQTSIGVTSGSISTWYSDNQANKGSAANPYMSLVSSKGTLVDVKSHAENTVHANEGLSKPVAYGGGDFEVQAKSLASTRIQSTATSSNVVINPTLPSGMNTALILEPYRQFALSDGAMDMSTTVFPALVSKGYATLRYTDSAASKDKFSGLDKYNVVLVKSHMNPDAIGLSTGTGSSSQVTYSELNYKNPPSHSLMILAGCSSFKPNSKGGPSNLANAVVKANLKGGYMDEVETAWNQDYMGKLFQNMATGMTFSAADNDAWTNYRIIWCKNHKMSPTDHTILELKTYGDTNFKL